MSEVDPKGSDARGMSAYLGLIDVSSLLIVLGLSSESDAGMVHVPIATADSVYHTEHLAQGPTVYAHEVYVLNGALPNETYTVTNNFHYLDPECVDNVFPFDTAVMTTGPDGKARAEAKVAPADVAGSEGVSGVFWTVRDSHGDVVYETECTAVTLD